MRRVRTCEHARVTAPSDVSELRPTNLRGAIHTGVALAASGSGVALIALHPPGWLWAAGQVLIACSGVLWFVLLHEAGHAGLFRARALNGLAGRVAGMCCGIPFSAWKVIHNLHHKWTGWQDKDPTTQSLVPRRLGRLETWLMNGCWRLGVPLFAALYRRPYWTRAAAESRRAEQRRGVVLDSVLLLIVYGLAVALAPRLCLHLLPGVIGSLILQELIILSQHTHVPMQVAGEADVSAIAAPDQDRYTRSLVFPGWLSWLLLRIERHGLHHMYPQVPGYHLHRVEAAPQNVIGALRWAWRAKRLRASVFLFSNRDTSGVDL